MPFTVNSPFLRFPHEKVQAFLDNIKTSKDNITIPATGATPFFDLSPLVQQNLDAYKTQNGFSTEHLALVNPIRTVSIQ